MGGETKIMANEWVSIYLEIMKIASLNIFSINFNSSRLHGENRMRWSILILEKGESEFINEQIKF